MTSASQLPLLLAEGGSNAALYTFLVYTLAVFVLAWFSNKLLQTKNFLSEYFLGSRGLGMWAFALTFAATSSSGGSFTGFPSKIYTHGWILGLWIASYMVVPICAMGLLGKRINQVARISGSITVPDVARDRFHSAKFGLLATLLIVFFMSFNLVAQFKAGSKILSTLLEDVPLFQSTAAGLDPLTQDWSFLQGVESDYLLCLVVFAVAVIAYTTYGGFHAVVWTDVMQGIVMVAGVIIMLPLAIYLCGGLRSASEQMAYMVPPAKGLARVELPAAPEENYSIAPDIWLTADPADEIPRLNARIEQLREDRPPSYPVLVEQLKQDQPEGFEDRIARLEKLRPGNYEQQIEALQRHIARMEKGPGVLLFRVSKRATIAAGEASTDGVEVIEIRTPQEIATQVLTLHMEALPAGDPARKPLAEQIQHIRTTHEVPEGLAPLPSELSIASVDRASYAFGEDRQGVYVTGPGPNNQNDSGFLPLMIAISFFFMWAISGAGQPSSMVRLMAFNNATTLRRSIFTVTIYYSAIYFPLVIIFCCARVLLPGREGDPDAIMPEMAVYLTSHIGMGWLAGLLVAAPFAAVMSTVDSFLLMISSALVRDVYQRNINPEVQEKTIKRLSYLFTLLVGTAAMIGAVNPPQFLQDIIVYTGSGLAACFLAPMIYALYWPRVNTYGATAAMLGGFLAHLAMYVAGIFENGSFFRPATLLGFNPVVIGLAVSFIAGVVVTLATPPPPPELVRKYFCKQK